MYFKLHSASILVKGKKEGCIYDLNKNRLFRLNKHEMDIVEIVEKGNNVDEMGINDFIILYKLEKESYGNFYTELPWIDKIRLGIPDIIEPYMAQKIKIDPLYLNISGKCNLSCYYCEINSHVIKRTGCMQQGIKHEKISFDHYKRALSEVCEFGCKTVYILGGEPFLHKDLLTSIIKFLKTLKDIKNVFILTNIYLFDESMSDIFDNEKLIINIIAHKDWLLHKIDRNKNTINNLVRNLEKLCANNIDHLFNFVISKDNYKYINEIIEFFMTKDERKYFWDYIFDESDKEYFDFYLRHLAKEVIYNFNDKQFFNNIYNHPCLNNKLTIFFDGEISICPMMKNKVIGNIKKNSLREILQNGSKIKTWYMSLNKLDKCHDCCFRFACKDCRALDQSITKNINAKYICPKKYIDELKEVTTPWSFNV